MIIEPYESFGIGDTIGFSKKYANQLGAKNDSMKCFEELKRRNVSFERKVLSIPRQQEPDGIVIDTYIPITHSAEIYDDFYFLEKNKIFSKKGIKVNFLNSPENFKRGFALIKEFCDCMVLILAINKCLN